MSAGQTWDPNEYARNARFVSDFGLAVVDLLDPRPGERILDLGCGDGALTEQIVQRGAQVVAVDSSPAMVAAARERGLDARVVDGHALPFAAEFDAVFSNAALHWMTRPDDVIHSVQRALRPQGRFVAEMGGQGNIASIQAAVHAALARRGVPVEANMNRYYPSVEEYRSRLEAAGFSVSTIFLFERPTPLPGDIGNWVRTFDRAMLERLPEEQWEGLIDEVRDALSPRLYHADEGRWIADYVRLRFAAVRSG
jgi:trans-aconitate methyltransferase